ncbi:hypothetical protein GTP41_15330 [Pseudoduganella sp. DS3]|uniref:Uncharacterized protein n=1 Tax=Pseudoduganella guangdongensis TaxID=2692179 RepID=A0A6N9HJQ7_9BURK|nr:hypothetical protein [Pseudoduganella guangdongensis]MYN03467.1 hypothetical protein [Pseudoduganella guangdongensis]
MNEAMQWLLIEGIAALFGAGGLYLLVGLLLFASMHTRGVKADWTPPRRMKLMAAILSSSILAIGYFARGGVI